MGYDYDSFRPSYRGYSGFVPGFSVYAVRGLIQKQCHRCVKIVKIRRRVINVAMTFFKVRSKNLKAKMIITFEENIL